MKRFASFVLALAVLSGCSTAGGIYKKGDAENGEFSPGRTILTILGVAAGIAAARHGGGGGGGGYAWDYQPGNAQWVCRNKANGEYAYAQNCAGVPMYDNWP